jgi:hypothetical protein
MSDPQIRINHPTDRPNYTHIYLPWVHVVFSYETPIAYRRTDDWVWVVRQNAWGATTGKHLNDVDSGTKRAKEERLPSAEFEAMLELAIHADWQRLEIMAKRAFDALRD